MLEGASVIGGLENLLKFNRLKNVKKFVVLAVSAETDPDVTDFGSDQIPTLSKALSSLIDVPINRYSADTLALIQLGVERARKQLRSRPRAADSPFTEDVEIYFINVSFNEIADDEERESLMRIPTTLSLTDGQIDRLLLGAARLIQRDPEFQRLMHDIETAK